MWRAPASTNQCIWGVNGQYVCQPSVSEPAMTASKPEPVPMNAEALRVSTLDAMSFEPQRVANMSRVAPKLKPFDGHHALMPAQAK